MVLGIDERKKLLEVSRGERAADLFIKGGKLVNVYSSEIYEADVAVYRGRIAHVGKGLDAVGPDTTVLDAGGKYIVPGYIEPHGHPWNIYPPDVLARVILPLGTTSLIGENLLLYLKAELDGFKKTMDRLAENPLRFWWMVRVAAQSPTPDEETLFSREAIAELLKNPRVVSIAELTRWPTIYRGEENVLAAIAEAELCGKRVDGHTAGCSYEKLNAVVAGGITSCHESITREEVLERLRLGLWVILRHSSLRQDLPELLKAVTEKGLPTHRMMLTTDASMPYFTDNFGFIDGLLRLAVEEGLDPVQAIAMVTLNPATYFGLEKEIGGIAPGRRADILLLPDLKTFVPETVMVGGRVVAQQGELKVDIPNIDWKELNLTGDFEANSPIGDPDTYSVFASGNQINFPVIDLIKNVITRRRDTVLPVANGRVDLERCPGMLYCSLVDRRGNWVANGVIYNFAREIGGMASSFNTAGELLVIGKNQRDMALAARRVAEMGGGIVLSEEGKILFEMPLAIGGVMSAEPPQKILSSLKILAELVERRGYPYHDLLYTLLFLPGDFLPQIRITRLGVMDIKTGEVLHSSRRLR
ncbi:adenine deaminase C-terminal domain-containing protein [Calderihabitans maritimus]|uniref:adenine deaminase n=1 Tax=Calderihabitans maritimus TaxID=1246530 RepID=A0A1Z5HSK5_9FIRM|nr:adenine deaminase C-terminal domain-containing protein [Calderihabitans maritimus]GAW92408.1 hypothetical protein KKC1_15620 [Calderihabitans maritimus]